MLQDLVSASLNVSDAVGQNMKVEGCAHACVFCFTEHVWLKGQGMSATWPSAAALLCGNVRIKKKPNKMVH